MHKTISDQIAFEEFLDITNSLHDSILREFSYCSRSYVDFDHRLFGESELADARAIFQSQSTKIPGVEVIFESVSEVRILSEAIIRPSITFFPDGIVFLLGGYSPDNIAKIIARKMKYRILENECLGKEVTTIKGIFSGENEPYCGAKS